MIRAIGRFILNLVYAVAFGFVIILMSYLFFKIGFKVQ